MASADDPAETPGGVASDGFFPGAPPRPTPPRAKRLRVEDEARAVFAPDLPDEILRLIFSRVAVDPRGGMPAVLAARAVCRSWRRAASAPALWRDIALKRWGFCADARGEDHAEDASSADRALCLGLARAPEAPASYARGRWQRAVAAASAFRVSFNGVRDVRRDERRRAATRTRRANGRARGETTRVPRYVTRDDAFFDDDAYHASARANSQSGQQSGQQSSHAASRLHLEPPFWRHASVVNETLNDASAYAERCRERAPTPGFRDVLDADDASVARTAWHVAVASAREPGAVVATDHALVLHVRDVPWKRLARNLACGLACVAVDAEIDGATDDEAELGAAGTASQKKKTGEKPRRKSPRWVRLCQVWARVGVTLTRCGATRSDARLILDGYARFSHAAPSRYSRELFGDGDDYKRNARAGYRPPRRPLGFVADVELGELELLTAAYRSIDETRVERVERDVDYRACPLLARLVSLQVARDARAAENDAREDVEGAAFATSALVALASEFVCAVSFTSDEELDAMFYAGRRSDEHEHEREHGHAQSSREKRFGVTFAPAVVVASLAAPRAFRGSPLATFRVGGAAAAAAARALETATDARSRSGLKCHLSFTHKSGVGYVYATALRPDAPAPEDRGGSASRSPRAWHFSERHRSAAESGTGGVFSASELEHDLELDGPVGGEVVLPSDDREEDNFEAAALDACRRWESGADGWDVTADVDPGPRAVSPSGEDGGFFSADPGDDALSNILPRRRVNWTREPRDDARAQGYFNSCGYDTAPDIDRVETPRMIQTHEASVSVGHSLLVTAPLSALFAASGRAAPRKTRREMER